MTSVTGSGTDPEAPLVTERILAYLAEQRLGRLASVDSSGAPQNNPVGFRWNAELATIDIIGWNLTGSRKFRNILRNPAVAFVVDDIASVQPWRVRMVEIRGRAEALSEAETGDAALIRIHPHRVITFGLDGELPPG